MGRASGRKNLPRAPQPGTPEGKDIGESALQDPAGSPIPGLTGNIVNYETVRRSVPVGESLPEHRGMMAHGVPPDGDQTTEERAQLERDGTLAQHRPPTPPEHARPVQRPPAVPVYLVKEQGGPVTFIAAAPRHITVPPTTSSTLSTDPVRVCGRDPRRNRIGLLNEDTANNIRFATRPSDLVNGGGALLPWPTNSYTWFETQDELYALAVGTAQVIMSIIEETEQEI
jgi:hypothetical protein